MRTFTVPAAYRRYVESEIALALANAKRDADRRADEHPGVKKLAWIPESLIDPNESGSTVIMVGVPDTTTEAAA